MRQVSVVFYLLTMLCGPVFADPALGVWLTEADRKCQVAHVDVHKCGQTLCGRIIKAFDASGQPVTTPNVGKRVFWNMRPVAAGRYEGRAWVPAHGREYDAEMQLNGNRMLVRGCLGPVCQSQKWARVQ